MMKNGVVRLILAIGSILLVTGCSRSTDSANDPARATASVDTLSYYSPLASLDQLRHLSEDDDRTFADYCRSELGFDGTFDLYAALGRKRDGQVPEEYIESGERLLVEKLRVARVLADEFGVDGYLRTQLARASADSVQLAAYRRLTAELWNFAHAADRRSLGREHALELFEQARDHRDVVSPGRFLELAAEWSIEDPEAALAYYRRAAWWFAQTGFANAQARVYGTIPSVLSAASATDSTEIYLRRSLELALQHAMGYFAGRAHLFLAGEYSRRGEYAQAHRSYESAVESMRDLRAGPRIAQAIQMRADFHRSLGCWSLVRDDLQPAAVVLRWSEGAESVDMHRLRGHDVRLLGASLLLRDGRRGEALLEFASVRASLDSMDTRQGMQRVSLAKYYEILASTLLDLGDAAAALPLARAGVEHCRVSSVPEHAAALWMALARAQWELGDRAACALSLAQIETFESTNSAHDAMLEIWSSVLSIRLALHAEDRTGAAATFDRALRGFLENVRMVEACPEAYLFLDRSRPLRSLAHDLLSGSASESYAFELLWRAIPVEMGRAHRETTPPERDLASELMQILRPAILGGSGGGSPVRWSDDGAIHLLFGIGDDGIRRWKRDGVEVDYELLAISPAEVSARLQTIRAAALGSAGELDSETRQALRELAHALLPGELLAGSTQRVLVSGDGVLEQLPFGALDIGSGENYRPWVDQVELGYARMQPIRTPPRVGSAPLVIASPSISEVVQQRLGELPMLPGSVAEAHGFARKFSDSRMLSGTTCTKAELVKHWASASLLYFACHVAQDPYASHRRYIPLAGSNVLPSASWSEIAQAETIDVGDVRSQDFSTCSLVVLSACSSGAPYLDGSASSASLANAFIDAGAAQVVQTSWAVRDATAAQLMQSFTEEFAAGADAIRALTLATRKLLARGVSPMQVLAYSVVVGQAPD